MPVDCQARTALWNNLASLKLSEYYYCRAGTWISRWDTSLSLFVALTSMGSAAAWLRDSERAGVCAAVIFVTQAIGAVKRFVPVLKKSGEYTGCSLAFQKLFIEAEGDWWECERGVDPALYEKALSRLRKEQLKVETRFCQLPETSEGLIYRCADRQMRDFFKVNFPHEQKQPSASSVPTTSA